MPEIVCGQVTNEGSSWVAATLTDDRRLQDLAFGPDEETARERCLKRLTDRIEREEAERRTNPHWVAGSGGQV